jgi:hypothetical protein
MKTIEQHLQELPEQVRDRALANMWWEDKDNKYLTAIEALRNAFNWSRSPEKYWFWYNVETDLLTSDLTGEEIDAILKSRKQRP